MRVRGRRLGLAGHAAFEVYSVLTRLRPPMRRAPEAVHRLLVEEFPATHALGAAAAHELLAKLPRLDIAGGSVYDALVGAATIEARLTLLTRDRRALPTYRALGVDIELIA